MTNTDIEKIIADARPFAAEYVNASRDLELESEDGYVEPAPKFYEYRDDAGVALAEALLGLFPDLLARHTAHDSVRD